MVKVYYGSLQTQSSTMSAASQSRVNGFQSLLAAFNSFSLSEGELNGQGYDVARAYATGIMVPYYQACILYSEAVADAANTLADDYSAKCGSEDLDEEKLRAEINSATRGCMSLSASISGLQSKRKPAEGDAARISSLQSQLAAAESRVREAQEKLDNLLEFSSQSQMACTSANSYWLVVSQGQEGVKASFSGGGFTFPSDVSWVSVVEEGWADREVRLSSNYAAAMEKVYNGEALTETDLTAIERYATAYPDYVDSSVLAYVKEVRAVKAEEMKYRNLINKAEINGSLSDEEIKFIDEYQKKHPEVKINPILTRAISDQKDPDKMFKKNLQEQYGFDQETANILLKLYKNIKAKEGDNADYVFNRLVGGIVYDVGYKDKLMWANTAGPGGSDGHHLDLGILKQLETGYGLTSSEYNKLLDKVRNQHKDAADEGINDFAHQSITTATSLYRGGHLRSANVISFSNSYKNTSAPWYEQFFRGVSKLFGAKEYTDQLAGWRGDVTGEALKEPTMGNDDYKADLDSVNIVNLMTEQKIDYGTAANQYYSDLRQGKYTRAEAFVENMGGQDKVLRELLDAESIEFDSKQSALQELKGKNPVAYDFYKNLTVNNGKGSNDLVRRMD